MASPKNWQRKRSLEKRTTEYAWINEVAQEHPGEEVRVYVVDMPHDSGYWAYFERAGGLPDENIGSYTNKRKARKAAVKWMREHPMATNPT